MANLQKDDIFEFGMNKWEKIRGQIKNCFWYDILNTWAIIIRNCTCDSILDNNATTKTICGGMMG